METAVTPKNKNVMSVMGREGDTKTLWDPDNAEEVEAAKETFKSLTKKGYLAFHVKEDGKKGEQMRKFDPKAGSIIMVPRMVGG